VFWISGMSEYACYPKNVARKFAGASSSFARPPVSPSIEELAAEQGIATIEDFTALLGHPSSEDETTEEFAAMLRSWRREGTAPRNERGSR